MLDRKDEVLDLEDIGLAEAAIEVEAEGMGGELGVQRAVMPQKLWAWLTSRWNCSVSWLLTVSTIWRAPLNRRRTAGGSCC